MTYNLSWSFGNTKLNKLNKGKYKTVGFAIPADQFKDDSGKNISTCPAAGDCKDYCFAKQGFFLMSNVHKAYVNNFFKTRNKDFVSWAVDDLKDILYKKNYKVVRIHVAGDFYNRTYLKKWINIAKQFPDRKFYAYTKMISMMDKEWQNLPSNLQIIQSIGGKQDSKINLQKPHSRVFASHAERKRAKYIDGNKSDLPAIQGKTKIGLVYHGSRKMNEKIESKLHNQIKA